MKIAVASTGPGVDCEVDASFGRAAFFVVVDTDSGESEAADNKQVLNIAQGAGIQAAKNVANTGAEAVIAGNVGPKAFKVLQAAGIAVFQAAGGTVASAVEALEAGNLERIDTATVEEHWV